MNSPKKILPKLYPVEKEISKTWFVLYVGKDGQRKKLYGQLNHLPTVEERLKEADIIIRGIIAADLQKPADNQLLRDLEEICELRRPMLSSKSVSAYNTHFFGFARWYRLQGCPEMTAVTATTFLNTITEAGRSNTTRNNYRNNLRTLWIALKKFFRHRYPDNPFAETYKVRELQKTKEWYRPDQVEQLSKEIPAFDPQLWMACKMMFHCFIRPNELRLLKLADIDWQLQKIRVESYAAKTSRIRFVPIPTILYEQLLYWKHLSHTFYIFGFYGKPGSVCYGRDTLSKRHKELLQQLNYEKNFTFYSWKNTGAVKMLCMDKHNLRYISKCMGHHSLDMTDKYFESLGVDEMAWSITFPEI